MVPTRKPRVLILGAGSVLGDTHHERDGNQWRGEAKMIRKNVDREEPRTTSGNRTPRKTTHSGDTLDWNRVASCLVGFVCAHSTHACGQRVLFCFFSTPLRQPLPHPPPSSPHPQPGTFPWFLGGGGRRCLTHCLQSCLWDGFGAGEAV